jgi:hypothetical protein
MPKQVTVGYFVCDNCNKMHKKESNAADCCVVELAWLERFKDCKKGDPILLNPTDNREAILNYDKMWNNYYHGLSCLFLEKSSTYYSARTGSYPRPATSEDIERVKTNLIAEIRESSELRVKQIESGERLFLSSGESKILEMLRTAK